MKLTQEQKTIVSYNLNKNGVLKIIAFAGTGKTTTLIEYTKARPQLKFLYVAFNKSVQLEADRKFPRNVTCKTSHSLAWPGFGSKYQQRLVPTLKANTVMNALDLSEYDEAKFTLDTLSKYLVSADKRISEKHIPPAVGRNYKHKSMPMPNFVKIAEKLWHIMRNGENNNIGMLHDGYLKLYQLSRPRLNLDCILLDEAQDINPVVTDIMLSQSCQKVLVGDPHQQIYSFRGASDAMQGIKAIHTMYLTHSFRFDNNIAWLANVILHLFKNETQRLVGIKEKRKVVFPNGNYTVIARTNATIFDEAVELYKQRKIGFVGGIDGYNFDKIVDTYYLYSEEKTKIKDGYLKSFNSYREMKDYSERVEDWELKSRCKIVEKYTHSIPDLVRDINNVVVDMKIAEVVLTTAHKSKGLEFDNVSLADDFPKLLGLDGKIINKQDLNPDEYNLIYVSITRARENLRVSSSLKEFVAKFKDDQNVTQWFQENRTKKLPIKEKILTKSPYNIGERVKTFLGPGIIIEISGNKCLVDLENQVANLWVSFQYEQSET